MSKAKKKAPVDDSKLDEQGNAPPLEELEPEEPEDDEVEPSEAAHADVVPEPELEHLGEPVTQMRDQPPPDLALEAEQAGADAPATPPEPAKKPDDLLPGHEPNNAGHGDTPTLFKPEGPKHTGNFDQLDSKYIKGPGALTPDQDSAVDDTIPPPFGNPVGNTAAGEGILKHARGPNDYVVPSPGMEACNESTSLFHFPAPTGFVNPLLQDVPASADVPAGKQVDVTRKSYEDKLAEQDDGALPEIAVPMTANRAPDPTPPVNQDNHPLAYEVVISKDYSGDKTLRIINGRHFQVVAIGSPVKVSEAIYFALKDSSVPFTSREL